MKILLLIMLTLSTLFAAIGEITAVKGEAQLQRDATVLPAEKGTPLEEKDLLETQKRSKVQVILNDETVITIGPESSYLFESYQDQAEPKVLMQLQHGFFKIVTGKIGKIAPQRFKVKTKAATIGIRGTQFMASVQEDRESIACSRGALVVETEKTTFELPAGMMLVYQNSRWSMHEIDSSSFEPIIMQQSAAPQKKTALEQTTQHLPDFRDSYTPLEQQIDKVHEESYQPVNDPYQPY